MSTEVDHPRESRAEDARASPVLLPGHTCWRLERASRAAFLVDGADYFGTLAAALELARRRVILLGWDFHSRVSLRRDGERRGLPDEFAPLLDALVRRRPALRIFVLEWDFSMLYWPERESLRSYRFRRRTHRRVRFRFDAECPVGASHHQKLVVIDDALAFAGGLDITSGRWDTRAHATPEPRRVDPDGRPYPPFHDVQMAVDGDAAQALAELARERWRLATGQRLGPVDGDHDPWPPGLEPRLRDVKVGIARTDPGGDDRPPVREVEALYRASIAAARRWIYVENQYLTSGAVAESLAARLREPEGPEVVIVVPERCSGWLEESSMGVLRDRFVRLLREADLHDRLRLLHPRAPGLGAGEQLNLHSKLMVVDDRLVRVGSANLSNRSMGLDSECDLAIEARRPEEARAIARFRDDLLAEHLGARAEQVEQALAREGSLVRTVESLGGGARRLDPVAVTTSQLSRELADHFRVFDPEQPLRFEDLLSQLGGASQGTRGSPSRGPALALLAVCILAFALWRLTPLADLVEPDALASFGAKIRASPLAAPLSALIVGLASLAFVPVTALIVACGVAFSPAVAFAVALVGSGLGAAAGHLLGRVLWRGAVRRLAGPRFQRVSRQLGRRGILATAAVRLLPVAPFGLVNMVAGASHVRMRDFVLGTALAMAPGTAVLVFASDRVVRAVAAPDAGTVTIAIASAAGAAVTLFLVRRAGSLGSRGARS
jgi:phosphatidylserine/phosphatidylglycerophosphate/cardiolipin synthase-like enzyme/uncharacterized membrane protein YdjX (TVP38/TMEM64 family)